MGVSPQMICELKKERRYLSKRLAKNISDKIDVPFEELALTNGENWWSYWGSHIQERARRFSFFPVALRVGLGSHTCNRLLWLGMMCRSENQRWEVRTMRRSKKRERRVKTCWNCGAKVPLKASRCPVCGLQDDCWGWLRATGGGGKKKPSSRTRLLEEG